MPPLTTKTGREFRTPDDLLEFIRTQRHIMLDPNSSLIQSNGATIEFVYAFMALDQHLTLGGALPLDWQGATGAVR